MATSVTVIVGHGFVPDDAGKTNGTPRSYPPLAACVVTNVSHFYVAGGPCLISKTLDDFCGRRPNSGLTWGSGTTATGRCRFHQDVQQQNLAQSSTWGLELRSRSDRTYFSDSCLQMNEAGTCVACQFRAGIYAHTDLTCY